MKLPVLAFICVNYKNEKLTLDFCESLNAQVGFNENFDIRCIVVDNSAESIDAEWLRRSLLKYKFADYWPADRNLGYFGGLNFGFQNICVDSFENIVVCNNDLKFDTKFCSELIVKSYRNDVFAVCPDVVTVDGVHQNPHVKKRIGWLRRLKLDIYFSHYFAAASLSAILKLIRSKKKNVHDAQFVGQEIHMGIGACYVLLKPFINSFKELNYPFFLYGEEAFFSDQVHKAGGILWFDPDLVVHHEESATLSKIPKRSAYEFAREGYSTYRTMI